MLYKSNYETDLIGILTLVSDGDFLIGCWFENDRFFGHGLEDQNIDFKDDLLVFNKTRDWLTRYFSGNKPDPKELPLGDVGSSFQKKVREEMLCIPYGKLTTYGQIAKNIEGKTGKRMSAQAVGGAVGRNPFCVIVPCHRVIGAGGNLTGFGAGIDTKVKLLQHEGVDVSELFDPGAMPEK